MIRVKAIGANARIIGGSMNRHTEKIYYMSDLGSFSQDFYNGMVELYWLVKIDGTIPTKEDVIREGIKI